MPTEFERILRISVIQACIWDSNADITSKVRKLGYGTFADALIPYEEIATMELARRKSPKGRDGLQVAREENAAYLAVGGKTDLTLHLRTARPLHGLFRPTEPVTTVHLSADEPDRLARELERRVGRAPDVAVQPLQH